MSRIFVLASLALAGGCATVPAVQTEQRITEIAGLETALTFQTIGEPIDVEAQTGALSLHAAVERAVRHDPRIQSALARVRIAQAEAKQSRLLPNPVLSVVARFPSGGGSTVIDAGLSANLLSLLQQPRQISAADNRLHEASADALSVALDVISEVEETYYTAQSLEARHAALLAQRELIDQLAGITTSRISAGEGTPLDQLAVDGERLELAAEIAEVQAELRAQRLTLARQIGQPSQSIDWQLAAWQAPNAIAGTERQWIETALTHRPEALAARWALAALGDERAATEWGLLNDAEVGIEAERDGDWSAGPGISVPLPLLDWGQARQAQADARIIEARHNLIQNNRLIVEDIRQALLALESAKASLSQLQSKRKPLAEQHRTQIQNAYEAGEASMTDVLLVEQKRQAIQADLITQQHRVSLAQSRLQRAAARSLPQSSLTVEQP